MLYQITEAEIEKIESNLTLRIDKQGVKFNNMTYLWDDLAQFIPDKKRDKKQFDPSNIAYEHKPNVLAAVKDNKIIITQVK